MKKNFQQKTSSKNTFQNIFIKKEIKIYNIKFNNCNFEKKSRKTNYKKSKNKKNPKSRRSVVNIHQNSQQKANLTTINNPTYKSIEDGVEKIYLHAET